MKKLFESWRGFINESMKTIKELPDGIGVLINTENSPDEIRISYVDLHSSGASSEPKGEVIISNKPQEFSDMYGACLNAWVVTGANATSGWGPLLYDIAIEWASMRGSGVGLAPDRAMVSAQAYAVWEKYANRQDVEVMQLDNPENELTQDASDNCSQGAAISAGGTRGMEWHQTPISKAYKKKGAATIRALQSAQKLVFREEGDL